MRTGANIKLTVPGKHNVEVSGGGTKDHSKLKNLGFDESGHTGFQKELTKEQLDAIGSVSAKENVENKVTVLSSDNTDGQYPSAKAVVDYVEDCFENKKETQSDWNQNDESQPDYVKNRTHYLKPVEIFNKNVSYVSNSDYGDFRIELDTYIPRQDIKFISGKKYLFENDFVKFELVTRDEDYDTDGCYLYINTRNDGSSDAFRIYSVPDYWQVIYTYVSPTDFERLSSGTLKIYEFVPVTLSKEYLPEDVEYTGNKVTEITKENTDDKYPSAKAVYDALKKQGDFEFIETGELNEKVAMLSLDLKANYKEIYVRLLIPKSDEADNANTIKAGWKIQKLGDGTPIFNMNGQPIEDFKYRWCTSIHIKVIGGYCRTELWYNLNANLTSGSVDSFNTTGRGGYITPPTPISNDYISGLTLMLTSPADTAEENMRYLQIGTTYEIWGIRK